MTVTMRSDDIAASHGIGYHGEPFRWDEVRRAQLRAGLNACYTPFLRSHPRLTVQLDHKEVHGEDFPRGTFRVLKDVRLYGEYRTSSVVLEAWDGQGKG